MAPQSISRKDFIRNSSVLLATGGSVLSSAQASAVKQASPGAAGKTFLLKNVLLETGFEYEEGEVSHTQTALFTIEISDGKIKSVLPNNHQANAIDARGLLMLPAFRDMHIHLDKTYYGLPWKAHLKKNKSVKDMIAFEQQVIPELLKTSTARSEKLIELLQSKGSSFARSHVNIEPTSKLDSLTHLQKALENKKDFFSAELVAFPQHGIYYTQSAEWMKEAAKMNVDFIGGLDPYTIDGNIEKSMDFVVQLALDHNKGIDIHLHEAGESGLKTVEYLIQKVNENPVLKGKTFISHCFVLAKLENKKLEEVAEKMARQKWALCLPFRLAIPSCPYPLCSNMG
jgi:cytosine/adenosine deaminase-related metal-dependent hydrolase